MYMKKVLVALRVAECIGIAAALLLSCVNINFDDLIGKTACFSVAAAIPDGLSRSVTFTVISEPAASEADRGTKKPSSVSGTDEILTLAVCAAVEEQIMGSVIKRTIPTASGNISSGSVYINNNTDAAVDIDSELSAKLSFDVTKDGTAQILIYHTHTTESFMTDEQSYYNSSDEPRSTDTDKNIVAVGDKIAEQLKNAGYTVIHDTTIHDHPGFTGSYGRSAETVSRILSENPNIKIAIDVHRDSISSGDSAKVAPVVTVNGREAAQVMLVMGSETGKVTGYPNWRENLRLALHLQKTFADNYPDLARSILLRSAKYNQDLTTGSILIEMGSDANTLDQALYSGELVGRSLVSMLEAKGNKD